MKRIVDTVLRFRWVILFLFTLLLWFFNVSRGVAVGIRSCGGVDYYWEIIDGERPNDCPYSLSMAFHTALLKSVQRARLGL